MPSHLLQIISATSPVEPPAAVAPGASPPLADRDALRTVAGCEVSRVGSCRTRVQDQDPSGQLAPTNPIRPATLPVIPRLHRAAREHGLAQPGRTWHLLRLLTNPNGGRVSRAVAVRFLLSCGYTRPTISRHLALGEGVLWRTSAYGRLYPRGAAALARLWGLNRLDGFVVLVPISAATSVAEWNALAYHVGRQQKWDTFRA